MKTIDEYLANVSSSQRTELERIRKIVAKTVPEAEECISYGMPTFKLKGKYLFYFAAFKNHMSIFPGSYLVEATKEKLTKFKISKGTVQFTADNPIPEDTIKEIVLLRKADITK